MDQAAAERVCAGERLALDLAGESTGEWATLFSDEKLRSRVVYGSHDPFGGDSAAALREALGDGADQILGHGAALLGQRAGALA